MTLQRQWSFGPIIVTALLGATGLCVTWGLTGATPDLKSRDERFQAAVKTIEDLERSPGPEDPPLLPVVDVDGRDRYARYRTYIPHQFTRDGKVERLACGNCDHLLIEGAKFCPECGTKIAPSSVSLDLDLTPSDVEPPPPAAE